jgi:hypothetical protein
LYSVVSESVPFFGDDIVGVFWLRLLIVEIFVSLSWKVSVSGVVDVFNWGTVNVWLVEFIKLFAGHVHVVLNTITISIIDGSWLEWFEFSGKAKELKIFWTVNEMHVVVEFGVNLEHFLIVVVVGDIVVTVTVDQVWNLNEGFWSISEWSSPVVGWHWIFTISVMTGELTVVGVVDIINVRSINIGLNLV